MRRSAFTFVELLCALALTALASLLLAALLHSASALSRAQTRALSYPIAARSALLRIADEVSCAFAPPPDPALSNAPPPFALAVSSDPSLPRSELVFLLPVPLRDPALPGFFSIHRVSYVDRPSPPPAPPASRDILRLSAPVIGPDSSLVRTQLLLRAPFRLSVSVSPPGNAPSPDPSPVWPLPDAAPDAPPLPASIDLALEGPSDTPLRISAPIHAAFVLPPLHDAPAP